MTEDARPPAGPLLLSLGSINADFQVKVPQAMASSVMARDFRRFSGGKAANVAYLGSKLGVPVRLLAHAGTDDLAEQALAPLRECGIDLSGVCLIPDLATGVAMITVPPDGKKAIVMAPNANDMWTDADAATVAGIIRSAMPGSVLVADCEIPPFIVHQAMRIARERGIATVLDPSPPDRIHDDLFPLADVAVPDAREAQALTGIECRNAEAALHAGRRLCERGVLSACVKLEDGGCAAVTADQCFHVAPVPVEVVDATGAGDAFAGALGVALLERRPWQEAVLFAVAASHLAVTRYGSQTAYPAREEILRFMHKLTVEHHACT